MHEHVTSKDLHKGAPRNPSGFNGRESGGALVVSAEDLLASRKGSSSEIISPYEKMAAVTCFSPTKTCNDPTQPCRYYPLRAQGALTALKRVYKVERSPYLYSARKFLPYPMWDVTNTPPCRHNVLVVSHGIAGPNGTNPHIRVGDRL